MTERELAELSRRLLRLHKSLLDEQRRDHESNYGPVASAELFRLLLEHEAFAWLRPLSSLIARIDEALEATPAMTPAEADALLEHTRRLFRPAGGDSPFTRRYHETLQSSPEVVMGHAEIMRTLPPEA